MITTVQPSRLTGDIQAPASKSSMQRACAAALLRAGETIIRHPGHSNDDKAALRVIRDLGATVETLADGSLLVRSSGVVDGGGILGSGAGDTSGPGDVLGPGGSAGLLEVNCGESGLGLRMFAPIIALSSRTIRVQGEGSLLKRPMDFFDEIFPQLGVRVVSNGGKLPLEIQGPLQPREIEIDGSLSSQFLTGLLFAYAAAGAAGVTIRVRDLKSKPYIDLTLQVMRQFGWEIRNRDYEEFLFGAERKTGVREYTVEGDWSGGAFLLVAGAVAGKIAVNGLDPASTQADKAILQALRDSGAAIEMGGSGAAIEVGGSGAGKDVRENGAGRDVRGSRAAIGMRGGEAGAGAKAGTIMIGPGPLKAFRFDATDCPDLFPPLVALAAYCQGTTQIAGVSRLAHKESDRGSTLRDEFGKMGVKIELEGDVMRVFGGKGVTGAQVHSRHDHRIAMACAVAALGATGETTIADAEAVNKSYPDFYGDIGKLGANVNIQL